MCVRACMRVRVNYSLTLHNVQPRRDKFSSVYDFNMDNKQSFELRGSGTDADNTGWSGTDTDNTGVERIPISHKESARQKADPGGEEDSPAALVTRTACRDLLPGSRLTRIRFSGQPSYLSPLPTPLWTSFRPKPRVDM